MVNHAVWFYAHLPCQYWAQQGMPAVQMILMMVSHHFCCGSILNPADVKLVLRNALPLVMSNVYVKYLYMLAGSYIVGKNAMLPIWTTFIDHMMRTIHYLFIMKGIFINKI